MPKINSANNSMELINLKIFSRIDPRKIERGKLDRSTNSIYRLKKADSIRFIIVLSNKDLITTIKRITRTWERVVQ